MIKKMILKRKKSIYLYSFGFRGTISLYSAIQKNRNLGVGHGDEVLYLFPLSPKDFRLPNSQPTGKDLLIREIMIDLWTSFAIEG